MRCPSSLTFFNSLLYKLIPLIKIEKETQMKRIFTVLALAATMALGACKEETAANRIYVFSQPGCPHCEHAEEYISRYYRNYDIERLNIREGNNMGYLLRYAKKFKVSEQSLGTPFIVMGDKYIMGWGNQQVKDFNRYAKNFKPKSSPLRSVAASQNAQPHKEQPQNKQPADANTPAARP